MGSRLSSKDSVQVSENKYSTSTGTQTTNTTEHYALLGLGRGVDITNHLRWLERTSFEVRHLTKDGIVETDNGRHLTAHSAEVESKTTLDAELKAGARSANLLTSINIAAENTRSQLSKKYIVGTKISNRTVSFPQDFSDVPHLPSDHHLSDKRPNLPETGQHYQGNTAPPVETATAQGSGDTPLQEKVYPLTVTRPNDALAILTEQMFQHNDDNMNAVACCEDDKKPFEQRLQEWLMQCRHQHSQMQVSGSEVHNDKTEDFEDIKRFVWHFGITHYVSALELGALSYKAVAEEKYERSSSVGHNASLDALPHLGAHTKSKLKSTKGYNRKSTKEMAIGRITQERFVAQHDEAVIGYDIRPISCLVKDPYLHRLLKCSIDDYIQKQCSGKSYILCIYHVIINFEATTSMEKLLLQMQYIDSATVVLSYS